MDPRTEAVPRERRLSSDAVHQYVRAQRAAWLKRQLAAELEAVEKHYAEEITLARGQMNLAGQAQRLLEQCDNERDALLEHYLPRIRAVDYVYTYEPEPATDEGVEQFFRALNIATPAQNEETA